MAPPDAMGSILTAFFTCESKEQALRIFDFLETCEVETQAYGESQLSSFARYSPVSISLANRSIQRALPTPAALDERAGAGPLAMAATATAQRW